MKWLLVLILSLLVGGGPAVVTEVAPVLIPMPTPTPTVQVRKSFVLLNMPFTSQAPNGEWSDPRHQDGCEEAAALMAAEWSKCNSNCNRIEKNYAAREIEKIWEWEVENYGSGVTPNYTAPGPERHMILIRGYDDETGEFITNDAGTRRGEKYRYKYRTLFNAIRDYPTGDHIPITGVDKKMIVVQ